MIGIVAVILIGGVLYIAAVHYFNRRVHPYVGPISQPLAPVDLPKADKTLSVMTWNIGYGALGKDADLVIDKGRSLRALSGPEIASAAQRIAARLAEESADVICLQENANAGFLNRGVPVRAIIDAALADRHNLFWADMKSVFVPQFLRLEHGMSVHARVRLRACDAVMFPQDDTSFYLGLKKNYGSMVSRLSIEGSDREWVVFNIHLSAFDPDADSRLHQLQDLLRLAQHAYDQGHFVVIAGDWNMRLTSRNFLHQTDAKDIFWAPDFPHTVLADGWEVAVDPETPTVRSLNASYVAGQNYTTIIDGFICSPNVALTLVSTVDLCFEFSDHHPVEARFRALT